MNNHHSFMHDFLLYFDIIFGRWWYFLLVAYNILWFCWVVGIDVRNAAATVFWGWGCEEFGVQFARVPKSNSCSPKMTRGSREIQGHLTRVVPGHIPTMVTGIRFTCNFLCAFFKDWHRHNVSVSFVAGSLWLTFWRWHGSKKYTLQWGCSLRGYGVDEWEFIRYSSQPLPPPLPHTQTHPDNCIGCRS